jgi:hypothetical protein
MLSPENGGSVKGGTDMSTAKKQASMFDWRNLNRINSPGENLPRVKLSQRQKEREDKPQISDLLGCFCAQTGAQFG